MGIGHATQKSFFKTNWEHRLSYGGILRKQRAGRAQRPISTKESLHVVFKIEKSRLRHKSLRSHQCFSKLLVLIKKYSAHFFVKIEQLSIQGDHIHILIRSSRRTNFHHFFRVVSGQIAQRFEKEGLLIGVTDTSRTRKKGTRLWIYRPFSRVVRGWKAYNIVRDYIQLNEMEARGKIKYQKQRLKGLSSSDWEILRS